MSSRTVAIHLSAELRPLLLIERLSRDGPAWKDEDHPELAAMGTAAWVRQLREEWGERPHFHDLSNDGEESAAE